jgi:hypothetical protein
MDALRIEHRFIEITEVISVGIYHIDIDLAAPAHLLDRFIAYMFVPAHKQFEKFHRH